MSNLNGEKMKKVLLLMAVATMIGFCSCNKSKDCKCTTTQTIPGMDPVVTETTLTIEKGNCSDSNATQTSSIGGQSITQVIECTAL